MNKKKKRKNIDYYVYGYVSEHFDLEFPAFQYSTRSLQRIIEFIKSVDFELLDVQVVSIYDDGSNRIIPIEELRCIANEVF